jgi:peptidoglycan-associated lipoprotein
MIRTSRSIALLLAATSIVACHKKKPVVAPPPAPAVNTDSIARANARRDSIAAADARERARTDSIARAEAARRDSLANAERMMAETRAMATAAVYFDYDKSDLSADARAILDRKVGMLQANSGLRLRIAGNTDERGSDEYNLALGQRRAAAAKRYLVQRGIDASRLEVTSNGKEKPAATGSDESAWSQNRRDEFEITAGGDNLMAPRTP